MVVTRITIIVILAATLAAAFGCAKKAEDVVEAPTCDCDEPCPDCACEKDCKAAGTAATAETPACPRESGPK